MKARNKINGHNDESNHASPERTEGMRLTDLDGNTLKVYLTMVAHRDRQDGCAQSGRTLSRLAGLARNTTSRALEQLEERGLISPQDSGWVVRIAPLAHLLDPVDGSASEPPTSGGGSITEPLVGENGSKTGPVKRECGVKPNKGT